TEDAPRPRFGRSAPQRQEDALAVLVKDHDAHTNAWYGESAGRRAEWRRGRSSVRHRESSSVSGKITIQRWPLTRVRTALTTSSGSSRIIVEGPFAPVRSGMILWHWRYRHTLVDHGIAPRCA